ncbi:hypothetical protein Tco_1562943 [Tanacetum coccineum]
MPDDDLSSVSGFEAADSDDTNDNEVSHSAHTSHDIASAERLSIPDHLDHIFVKKSAIFIQGLEIWSLLLFKQSLMKSKTQAQLNKKVVKQLNRQFNISHVSQSNRFVTLQKELSKVIKSEVAKKVQVVRLEGVREDLQSQTKHISKYSSSFQDMQTQPRDVKDLLESAVIINETAEGEKKQKDINAIPALTQREQKTAEIEEITHSKPSPEI